MKKTWIFLVGLALLASCGTEMPEDIIQPDKMEKVLYDYHLSIGMETHFRSDVDYHRNAFKAYVFKKHGITDAEFDSSMVWYTRNAQELSAIYENLQKRFEREHAQLETLMESRQEENRSFVSGDTVDVWTKGDLYWLSLSPLNNQLAFEVITDTTFHAKDAFLWSLDFHFLKEGEATMGFNVIYDNDSVIGKTMVVSESGNHTCYLQNDSAFKVKSLNGFVYLMKDSVQQPELLLHNITLTRYHAADDSLSVADPVKLK